MIFSLIIPVYNEALCIKETLMTLCASLASCSFLSDWEIVVVDNASADDTVLLVQNFGDAHVRVITIPLRGKGRAIRAGFRASRGDVVGFTDADLSVSSEDILYALKVIQDEPNAVVIGSRFHHKSALGNREWWRTGSSRLFNLLARGITDVHYRDTQCPLKVRGSQISSSLCSLSVCTFQSLNSRLPGMNITILLVDQRYTWGRTESVQFLRCVAFAID
jgi:glycosyltransferase involved in cell wall biosynthesis